MRHSPHSPPASSARSAQITKSASKSERPSTAFISASSTISMPSFVLSASKPRDKSAKREQNPHYSRYNGLIPATREPCPTFAHPAGCGFRRQCDVSFRQRQDFVAKRNWEDFMTKRNNSMCIALLASSVLAMTSSAFAAGVTPERLLNADEEPPDMLMDL